MERLPAHIVQNGDKGASFAGTDKDGAGDGKRGLRLASGVLQLVNTVCVVPTGLFTNTTVRAYSRTRSVQSHWVGLS